MTRRRKCGRVYARCALRCSAQRMPSSRGRTGYCWRQGGSRTRRRRAVFLQRPWSSANRYVWQLFLVLIGKRLDIFRNVMPREVHIFLGKRLYSSLPGIVHTTEYKSRATLFLGAHVASLPFRKSLKNMK